MFCFLFLQWVGAVVELVTFSPSGESFCGEFSKQLKGWGAKDPLSETLWGF
jgi:hypothetical protein